MAVGDRNESRIVGPVALANTGGAITSNFGSSTVAANRVWIIKQITVCNTAGADALVYLACDPNSTPIANSHYFMWGLPVASFDTVVFDTNIVMTTGDQLYGYADRNGVNIIVNGWVKEV